ncbi:Gfo/Idh/MocA family protein [Paenibacillus cremeus]|uniref:Gfo/Idh/MocA family oxidoreductase n=1 Tax=Paenibacillus cremeus TaxID=2163881 RepID=A0A559KHT1_9BACL|nr:Gfo/Idh/MocA family oxidoreductase [Paenibacillus cremeus]TVY11694.1 Gfo/Idh/MocA family oxidoreductase [Paenibacillus cremeus]
MSRSDKIVFGIIGGGWRAEFYLRIAQAIPSRFEVGGMVVRDSEKGRLLEQRFGVTTFRTLESLLESVKLHFVVVSVPWAVCPGYIEQLAERHIAVLAETPPAPDLEGLIRLHRLTEAGARVQVAEQYPLQPRHQAILAIIRSGLLGEISHAQVSVAHGYHGIAMMRQLLGAGMKPVNITGQRFTTAITAGPSRAGAPAEERMNSSRQDIAVFDFGDQQGVFDFSGDQYFSWIRSNRLLVRGARGEIAQDEVRYLEDFRTPIHTQLRRINAGENGNLEGYYLKGIQCGSQWVYVNPFEQARLSDDELAVATCLLKMADYAGGGDSFYSLADASQDHYLSLLLNRALESGEPVVSEPQPWSLD